MSRNDIRLRRKRFTATGADRFRNYGAVLERHAREQKLKRITRIFTFVLLIGLVVLLWVAADRWLTPEKPTPAPVEKSTSQP